jgi:TonB-dependent starch-binding outer membrane protein SusC
LPSAAFAQAGHTVSGIITSEKGETLPGVTVIVKGTTIGATTNAAGEYSLTVPDGNKTLVISSIGYEKQEVVIGSSGTVSAG